MIRFIRELRLIPIALVASACLLVLKIADLAFDGGRWLTGGRGPAANDETVVRRLPEAPLPPTGKQSWAQQMFNFPGGSDSVALADIAPRPAIRPSAARIAAEPSNGDITGTINAGAGPPEHKNAPAANPAGSPAAVSPNGTVIPTNNAALPLGSERVLLERLQQRREELDNRARELDIRENLLKAAAKRLDARLKELKETEARITDELHQKDAAEAARFKGLVAMYEAMKPRDAAKIFERLDMAVLLQVASQINPRQMADIMAQMSPDMAQRLTMEMASKAEHGGSSDPATLPKIEGKPTAN